LVRGAEAEELGVQGQPGLRSETLSQTKQKTPLPKKSDSFNSGSVIDYRLNSGLWDSHEIIRQSAWQFVEFVTRHLTTASKLKGLLKIGKLRPT
jgi:hypothetical protein